MRQDPERILAAHRMDPDRRELYVEGPSDRVFLDWLTRDQKGKDARIIEIDLVELPTDIAGGKKGRLIAFAKRVEGASAQIKMLADADTDRIFDRAVPGNVLLTDNRDLEGYLLGEECVDKVIRLGHLDDSLSAKNVLQRVTVLGRELGTLRLMSELDGHDLPFRRTDLKRYLRIDGREVHLRLDAYVTALLQNAGISLSELSKVTARHKEIATAYCHVDDAQIVHGKDAVIVLDRLLRANGLQSEDTEKLLRCSYERAWIPTHPSLQQAYEFLTA